MLHAEGYLVDYERVPITDEKSPKERDFDLLVQHLYQKNPRIWKFCPVFTLRALDLGRKHPVSRYLIVLSLPGPTCFTGRTGHSIAVQLPNGERSYHNWHGYCYSHSPSQNGIHR